MRRIVHYQRLGDDWERELESLEVLALTEERIVEIRGPESEQIELTCGLKAFFVPGRGHRGAVFAAGRDENRPVQLCLAFTYDR
jgi:hypothetical protein